MTIIYIIVSLFFLSFIIFVHELFHLVAAKMLKIEATEFAIGMGPSIFAFQKQEKKIVYKFFSKKNDGTFDPDAISYHIRAIPLGGYVNFGKEKDGVLEDGLMIHKPWKRIIVAAAGPIGNLLFAVLLMLILLLSNSYHGPGLKIVSVVPDSLAHTIGLEADDELLKVNGKSVDNRDELKAQLSPGSDVCIIFKKDGETRTKCGTLSNEKEPKLGIQYRENVPMVKAIPMSFEMTYLLSTEYIKNFVETIYGLQIDKLSGPVGIVDTMQQNVTEFQNFIEILILINIALGIANLLFPFSITDGGRIVIDILAILFRKDKIPTKYLDIASVGLMLLMMLTTTFLDISRLLQ